MVKWMCVSNCNVCWPHIPCSPPPHRHHTRSAPCSCGWTLWQVWDFCGYTPCHQPAWERYGWKWRAGQRHSKITTRRTMWSHTCLKVCYVVEYHKHNEEEHTFIMSQFCPKQLCFQYTQCSSVSKVYQPYSKGAIQLSYRYELMRGGIHLFFQWRHVIKHHLKIM